MQYDASMLHRVEKVPDSAFGILLASLFGRAGDGVLAGGNWYHYRRGVFVRDGLEVLHRARGYVVRPLRKVTESDVAFLDRMVGERWHWWANCFTRLHHLWK